MKKTVFSFGMGLGLLVLGGGGSSAPVPWKSIAGQTPGGCLGHSVSSAGDVNGDGRDDIVVGVPYENASSGRASVLSGRTGGVLHSWTGIAGSCFGFSVAGAGDADGDGFPEIIVGAPGTTETPGGSAFVYSGRDGSLLWSWTEAFGNFGYSVDGAGDMDADGIEDFIVGNPNANSATAFSGATGAVFNGWTGDTPYERFGAAVAGGGDLNQDGHADVLIGAPLWDAAPGSWNGKMYAYCWGVNILLWAVNGPTEGARLGSSLAAIPDVTGDGINEVLAGAPYYSGDLPFQGIAYEYNGRTGAFLWERKGENSWARFGASLSAAGDVDGDGAGEVLIGSPGNDGPAGDMSGSVYRCGAATGALLAVRNGLAAGDRFGHAVEGNLKLDSDGRKDFVVGAPCQDGSAGVDVGQLHAIYAGNAYNPIPPK